MEIKNAKELSKIIDICRKKGVDSIEISGIKLTLNGNAPLSVSRKKEEEPEEPIAYTPEQILLWSTQGIELNG